MTQSNPWRTVLTLDAERRVRSGSAADLRAALARGADLRVGSEFRHNEHIDTSSADNDLVRETMDMRVTYVVDGRWAAGTLTLRQPVALPDDFGPRPSLSLFLYNEDGTQAIARPFLDGLPAADSRGKSPPADHSSMPKYHELDRFDDGTNAPSSNFIYDFDVMRWIVRDDWTEAFAHTADGVAISGSIDALGDAFAQGADIKVGIRDLCDGLGSGTMPHEVFVHCGSCYYYTGRKLFIAGSHPLVRVAPAVPLRYGSGNWDYSWLLPRTDGQIARLTYDPYTLNSTRHHSRHAIRWFYR